MATGRSKLEYEALRHRARTDLFWLGKEVLGYDLVERVHKPVCELFVHKDYTKPIAEQDTIKERLLLDPRGHFKTTLDICDIIQWLLCFPNVRILIMTGTLDLAKRMLFECKAHFLTNQTLRDLFPEYAPPAKDEFGRQDEFTVPARTSLHLREPSVSISTIDAVKAGSHYDVIKCDDLVHENNINTPEQLEKTIQAFNYTTPLLEPYGYRDIIGTRYDHSDLYGWIIDNNKDGRVAVFKRAVWEKDAAGNLKLLFPERFTLDWLNRQKERNPYIFSCQYLNDPTPPTEAHFTEPLIQSRTLPHTQLPPQGRTFIAWDLGFSRNEYSDYSVGAVGRFNEHGQLFILDLIRGRYSPYELVTAMLSGIKRWKPARMLIEKAGGSDLVLPGLTLAARERKILLPPIDLVPTSPRLKKVERIAGLHPLLHEGRLWFSAGLTNLEQLTREFVRFPKYARNDIPDAISMLLHYRTCVDVQLSDDQIEIIQAPVMSDDGLLGAGLCG